MITKRAWKLWLGIHAGNYDYPVRTKFNILKLVRLESKLICWVIFTLITLIYIGFRYKDIIVSGPLLVLFTILLFVEALNLASGISDVKKSRVIWGYLLKAVSFLDLYINSPEILEEFGSLGISNPDSQKIMVEKRLRSMAEVAKSLRNEVGSTDTAELAHNAMEVFINFSDSCLISGLTEKPGREFFPKDKVNG